MFNGEWLEDLYNKIKELAVEMRIDTRYHLLHISPELEKKLVDEMKKEYMMNYEKGVERMAGILTTESAMRENSMWLDRICELKLHTESDEKCIGKFMTPYGPIKIYVDYKLCGPNEFFIRRNKYKIA